MKSPSIRRKLASVLAMLGVLVAALVVVTTLQLRTSARRTDAENKRNQSFRLADSMRQSSNDLTRMVRLYVSTGDPRYRQYYDQILAIRSGDSPRPRGYGSSFWDRVLAEGTGFVEYGAPESLVDLMRAADFTRAEFDALSASLRASNGLAAVELEVMDTVGARISQGVDAGYVSDVASEYRRLVDANYMTQKAVIMRAIENFIARVEARTQRAVDDARDQSRMLSGAQIAILGLIVIIGLAALRRTSRVLLRPLDELVGATEQIAAGRYDKRVSVGGVSELEGLATAFNTMATSIQSDVAARQRAELEAVEARAAAEDANKAKSTFLASMSHEIRTPMIGVTGMLEVLAQSHLDPEQQSMVSVANGSAQALLQIIGDTLDFSKIESGKLELAPTPFMTRSMVEAVAQTFFHTASAKGVRLSCSVDDAVADAHVGDALRLRQILSNFLSNAVKFTSEGEIVLVTRVVADDGGETQRLEFSVRDTGVGVSPEDQQRLFTEFTQASASTAGRSGGTGLGLVICQRLATLMGGNVRMESEVGRGTTMYLTVRLPVSDPGDVDEGIGASLGGVATMARRTKPSRGVAEREGSVVLLAEDHPINRRVMVHQLGIIGFHVDTAEDGDGALELFRRGDYGLVLTDLNMPGMDGFELTDAIRREEADTGRARTPVIAVSANVMSDEAEKCMAAGMDDFIGKPAPMPALAAKLKRWLPDITWDADVEVVSIDLTVLNDLTGGDDDLAAAILDDFVGSLDADLAALRSALDEARGDEVRRVAHRIKGAARIVGAHDVAGRAERLESAATDTPDDGSVLEAAATDLIAAADNLSELRTSSPANTA